MNNKSKQLINNIGHSVTFGKTENGMGAVGKTPDWQSILIADSFVEEIDCNSGDHRRVFNNGVIKYLENK